MKLSHIDIKNVCHLVPTWAANPVAVAKALDRVLQENARLRPKKWHQRLCYWIELTLSGKDVCEARVASREPGDETPPWQIGSVVIDTEQFQICVPLNAMLKGSDSLDKAHSLYAHSLIGAEGQRTYVGLTKQRWFDRLSQHKSAANNGSMLLFHRALRHHAGGKMSHVVVLSGVSYEYVMENEEKMIDMVGLYPKGLNMIPGGFAGLKYLGSLGLMARSLQERDESMQLLVSSESLVSKPNPLCAARWSSDQEYVNSVICGHSCRLTLSQVRSIRMLGSSGYETERIAAVINDSASRVKNVLSGKVYARVA